MSELHGNCRDRPGDSERISNSAVGPIGLRLPVIVCGIAIPGSAHQPAARELDPPCSRRGRPASAAGALMPIARVAGGRSRSTTSNRRPGRVVVTNCGTVLRFSPTLSGNPRIGGGVSCDESVGSVLRRPVLPTGYAGMLGLPCRTGHLRAVGGRRGLPESPPNPGLLGGRVIGPRPFTVDPRTFHVFRLERPQLRTITRCLASLPPPRILCGDLNLPGRVPVR